MADYNYNNMDRVDYGISSPTPSSVVRTPSPINPYSPEPSISYKYFPAYVLKGFKL